MQNAFKLFKPLHEVNEVYEQVKDRKTHHNIIISSSIDCFSILHCLNYLWLFVLFNWIYCCLNIVNDFIICCTKLMFCKKRRFEYIFLLLEFLAYISFNQCHFVFIEWKMESSRISSTFGRSSEIYHGSSHVNTDFGNWVVQRLLMCFLGRVRVLHRTFWKLEARIYIYTNIQILRK